MDIDQRLEFLLHSTGSLHATAQELAGRVQELTNLADKHTKQLEIDAANIRRLANIAAAHQQRLDNLEGLSE